MSTEREPIMPRKSATILSPEQLERRRAFLAAYLESNKSRKRRGEDPPAAMPALVEPKPKGPRFSGGAAAALTFEPDELV